MKYKYNFSCPCGNVLHRNYLAHGFAISCRKCHRTGEALVFGSRVSIGWNPPTVADSGMSTNIPRHAKKCPKKQTVQLSKSLIEIKNIIDVLEAWTRTNIGSPVVSAVTFWDDGDFAINLWHTQTFGMSLEEAKKQPDKCRDIKHLLYYLKFKNQLCYYQYRIGDIIKEKQNSARPIEAKKLQIRDNRIVEDKQCAI